MKKILFLLFILNCFISNGQTWVDCQNSNYVISAASTSSPGNGSINATDSTIAGYQSHFAIDAKHKFLYVADRTGNRVLRFSYPITKNQPKANLVYGQSTFNTKNANTNVNSLATPLGVAVDSMSGTLWILDGGNNRVLRFDSAHKNTVNKPNADQVLGQSNFFSNSPGTTQSTFTIDPFGSYGNLLYYDHATGNLWVGDNSNCRVLLFTNAKTLNNGDPASAVLGQSNYTSNSTTCTASGFGIVYGITMIGNSLFVTALYHRVLRFDNVYSKINGAPADAVFGQTSFTTSSVGCSATQMNIPMGITADNSKLYVCDWMNNRIIIFNSATTNTIVSNVLWATNVSSPGNNACTSSSGLSCESITMDPIYKQLLISDAQYKRIMVYNAGVGTGIMNKNENYQAEFSLYPNPTSGELTVKTTQKGNLYLEIYNLISQQILKQKINEEETKINLKDQANGIYFVKVTEEGKIIYHSKVIKQ